MCGIAGQLELSSKSVSPESLKRMIHVLSHRGPDASGIYTGNEIGLAHARLSIIDLATGSQPMCNRDKSLYIIFNGEIFNYVELREDLKKRGHVFSTESDTEVLLRLYEEEGPECLFRLNGQWAFAVWDVRKKTLFLARDPFGILPLYYTVSDGGFFFASEVKALFQQPRVTRAINPVALDEIFTFWFPVAPNTIFKDIFELPPGHSLSVSRSELKITQYSTNNYSPQEVPDENACASELIRLLTHATAIRLRADVPVGAYLSGGLDSTLTAALSQQQLKGTLQTFSLSFEEPEFDEKSYQVEAARFLNTRHEHLVCTSKDIQHVFPEVIWHTECPILRTAPAPMFLLSKLVRESGCKVIVTGEGADELFGGYDIFKEAKVRHFWATQPNSHSRPLLLRKLYPWKGNLTAQSDIYLQSFFKPNSDGMFFSHEPRWNLASRMKIFFAKDFATQIPKTSITQHLKHLLPHSFEQWDWFSRAEYLESAFLLPEYILSSQGDRVNMAHAVETRFPFLDPEVAAFARCLPSTLKLKVLREKYLLKKAARDLIPVSVANRFKQPYRAPGASSFFKPYSPDYVTDLLSTTRILQYGIFDPVPVNQLVEKFRAGQAIGEKENMALVGILSTQLVVHQFIKC
jgi:asparagine synthase (glutamine-hydrolysing)